MAGLIESLRTGFHWLHGRNVRERSSRFYDRTYFTGEKNPYKGRYSLSDLTPKYWERLYFLEELLGTDITKTPLDIVDIGAGAIPFARTVEELKKQNRYSQTQVISTDFSRDGYMLMKEENPYPFA